MTKLPTKTVAFFTSKLGYQTRSFEAAAGRLGVRLAYVTDRCHELSDPWGDQAIAARFANPEEAAAVAIQSLRGGPLDAILALGDGPAVAASYAARGLGVRSNHPAAVEACHNKLRMREVFRDAGLLNPWFRAIPLRPEPEPSLLGIQYPCVLKPLSLSASQGVIRANSREEFLEAARRLALLLERPDLLMRSASASREALVEEYLPGVEVALEGILIDGDLKTLALFDKPDPLEGPFFEETIYVVPSRLSAAQQSAIQSAAKEAIGSIGLSHGPVHAEFRINERGVWPIEVAPRPIGGMCAASLSFVSAGQPNSIGLEELILRHALGEDVSAWRRETQASGVMMIPVPSSGIFEQVDGIDEAKRIPHISDLQITARLRDVILAWPEGSSYLGFIFAKSENPADVERALREAHSRLRFKIRQTLPVEHPITGKVLDPQM
jgi:D-alanine-D-alanine ligase-like ATP-grasp enzyme